MNYACITDKPFIAKELLQGKCRTKEASLRKKFIQSHDFSIVRNPLTNEREAKVTKIQDGQ